MRQCSAGSCLLLLPLIILKALPTLLAALIVAALAYTAPPQDQQLQPGTPGQADQSKLGTDFDNSHPFDGGSGPILKATEPEQSLPLKTLGIQLHPTLRSLLILYDACLVPLIELHRRINLLFILGIATLMYFNWVLIMVRVRAVSIANKKWCKRGPSWESTPRKDMPCQRQACPTSIVTICTS